jgi:hypothetical protein
MVGIEPPMALLDALNDLHSDSNDDDDGGGWMVEWRDGR